MTEVELMAEFALRADRVWETTQWWASVTFAVLVGVHVGSESLNRLIVAIVLVLYTLFSVLVVQIIIANFEAGGAAVSAMTKLAETTTLSAVGQNMLNEDPTFRVVTMATVLCITFISTLVYVVYSYRRGRGT